MIPSTPERGVATDLHARILTELDQIKDPCSLASGVPMGLDEMGLVDTVEIGDDGRVDIRLRLTSPFCHMIGFFHVEAKRRIMGLSGVTDVHVSADTGLDWSPSRISPAAQARRAANLEKMTRRGEAVPA